MNWQRGYSKVTYSDGREYVFDPLIRWNVFVHNGIVAWIGLRGFHEIGFMWGYVVGDWSRIRTRWTRIGRLTLFVRLGECEPYNPRTGEVYE